jgi:exoribonuclease R
VPDAALIERAFDRLRRELGVRTAFPPEVLAAAEAAAGRDPSAAPGREDLTALPFVTVDPPGSRDLDQALCLMPDGAGFRAWYAIADVGFWVERGGAIEAEAWLRGETTYAPDRRDPLYPPRLSEGAASLLPGAVKPVIVFELQLDARAGLVAHHVRPALVRSRAQLTYEEVAEHVERGGRLFAGEPWGESLALLKTVGEQRRQREAERGGVSLPIATQHVERSAAARLGYRLGFEEPCVSEDWNAQLSLLAGHAAALRMVEAKVGLLRVLAPAEAGAIDRLRRAALGLGFAWPEGQSYPDFMRALDPTQPLAATLVWQARRVMRGADYVAFDGALPADPLHHALAMVYAHCTAPLRRLADRYVLDLLVELAGGGAPSAAERGILPDLARTMNAAEARGSKLARAVVDLAEAWTLRHRVGETFPATVLSVHGDRVEVQMDAPPVRADAARGAVDRWLDLGESVRVRLVGVDLEAGTTDFALAA